MRAKLLAVLALGAVAAPVQGQRPTFSPTLYWDSGLIDTPAAWVAPLGGDVSLHFMRLSLDSTVGGASSKARGNVTYNMNVGASLWGRAEIGLSIFTSDLKGGLFAKGLLWDQLDGSFRHGPMHWMPSVAVGIRNLFGPPETARWATPEQKGFETANSLYAVATRTFALGSVEEIGARAKTQLTLNVGIGNGWFANDGGRGAMYAKHPTGGVFAGAKVDFATSRFSNLALMAEQNGWDYNVGAVFESRGLRVGAYVLEADAGAATPASWSYRKVAMSVGWQTNVLALLRGNRMEERVAQIERERDQLTQEIRAGEARVVTLETQLKNVEGATEADRRAQRELLEAKLREEQEALRRLQERLNARKPPEDRR